MTRTPSLRLVAAVFVAVSVHAAAATGLLLDESAKTDTAINHGTGGVMVIVASTAAGSVAGRTKSKRQAPLEPAPEVESAPEETPPIPAPSPRPVQPQKPVQPLEVDKLPHAALVVQKQQRRNVAPPPRKSVPVPKRKPAPPEPTARQHTVAPAERSEKAADPIEGTARDSADVSVAAATGDQGGSERTQTARSGGGDISTHGAYLASVRDWLYEHKRYPRRARIRMLQGEALIGFVLDRSGRVISYELRRSTGHKTLDREVVAMIRRASPMPPFPPEMAKNRLRFTVPVNFNMR